MLDMSNGQIKKMHLWLKFLIFPQNCSSLFQIKSYHRPGPEQRVQMIKMKNMIKTFKRKTEMFGEEQLCFTFDWDVMSVWRNCGNFKP